MKAKKLLAAIALTLAATTLTACGDKDQTIEFNTYWHAESNAPTLIDETLEYDVTFDSTVDKSTVNYELDYKNGTYTTHLVSNSLYEYTYTTSFSITAIYTYKDTTVEKQDSVETKVTFSTEKGFRPIRSEKSIVSHSPVNSNVSRVNQAYDAFYRHVETDYTGSKAVCKIWDTEPNKDGTPSEKLLSEETFKGKSGKYSYLDNEQLWVAIRAIEQTANAAPKFSVYAPFTGKVQTVSATFKASITEENFSFMKDGTQVTQNVTYFPVELVLDEKNAGSAQTLWIAATKDAKNNTLRNVVIKNIVKVPYNIGTLTYQLKEATFHF
jgi:uncharacterized lipoprotein YehR (DUF1307 family)